MEIIHNKIPNLIYFFTVSMMMRSPAYIKYASPAAKFSLPKSAIYEILSLIK